MRWNIVWTTILSFYLGLNSCVPQQNVSGERQTLAGSTGEETDSEPEPPVFNSNSAYWHNANKNVGSTLILNENSNTVTYLRGERIHNFLSLEQNMSQIYCLVASFNSASIADNLRLRAIPISFPNFSTNTQEKLLRIDIPERDLNAEVCDGPGMRIIESSQNSFTATSIAYSLPELCPTCRGVIHSTNISLYLSANGSIDIHQRIAEDQLILDALDLRIDTSSSRANEGQTCTQAQCSSKGLDCCLENQCVKDGALRPQASSHTDYASAIAEVALDAQRFIQWPHIYFVCPRNIPTERPIVTEFPDADASADARLQELIAEYQCLEEGKKEESDFAGMQVCGPNFNQSDYIKTRNRVWDKCGCDEASSLSQSNTIQGPRCPGFGLKVVRGQDGSIIEVVCDIPPKQIPPKPFQELKLEISANTAPHRFFRRDDGQAIDDLTQYTDQMESEGAPFHYLDDVAKTNADSAPFSMNALIGSFSLALDQALPAKVVYLEPDQSYIIATTSGYYTPCFQCSTDNWFEAFSAHPRSDQGKGLEAIGYTTNRSVLRDNTSLGNYEDTVFGRACWLPPTMLPFAHQKNSDVVAQRRSRLETQAALYVNGYQRDWYGFNQGALIGSFDGVTWFAVGKARRVVAKTKKLFLAINRPFADLADPSSLSVQILLDTNRGETQAANFDYHPELEPEDPNQSTGASCQRWHQCETDSDCITRLGWEYKCATISSFRTHWPKFNIDAEELGNQEYEEIGLGRILEGNIPSGSRKRCVYRGAGTICKKNYTTLEENQHKLFACAPNFYCADLGANHYNSKVARDPEPIDNFLFGQESDVLGRPLSYMEGDSSLSDTAQGNIRYNAQIYDSGQIEDFGICRPGKSLATAFLQRHLDKDNLGRADYINQISSCANSLSGGERTLACPAIETRANQNTLQGDIVLANETALSRTQNMCGGEGQFNDSSGEWISPFSAIELAPLPQLSSIQSPGLATDACLRRTGALCHTDLDCSPGRLHQEQTFFLNRENFGGTDAELMFWQESLICGQATPIPNIRNSVYYQYDMSQNRCCRTVGKEFTMFSETYPGLADDTSAINTGLDVDSFPADNPRATGRYSRYEVAQATDGNPAANPNTVYPQAPIVTANNNSKSFQWKTFQETGKSTCCGGGWIRKFADEGHDWTLNDRISFDIENFSCLNYDSELYQDRVDFVEDDIYQQDYQRLCLSPADGGCIQRTTPQAANSEILNPRGFTTAEQIAVLSTKPISSPFQGGVDGIELSDEVLYAPVPFPNPTPMDVTNDAIYNYMRHGETYTGVSFYLPAYIGYSTSFPITNTFSNIESVSITYVDESLGAPEFFATDLTFRDPCPSINDNPEADLNEREWCIRDEGGFLVFHARADDRDTLDLADDSTLNQSNAWDYAYVDIEFRVQGRGGYYHDTTPNPTTSSAISGLKSGNDLYYLTKLSRFELLGIPQIFYEPIYCNSNRSQLIAGLFDVTQNNRTGFDAISFVSNNLAVNGRSLQSIYDPGNTAADASNPNSRIVLQDRVNFDPVFSSSLFQCCVRANYAVKNASECCSHFAVDEDERGNSQKICKIPDGTNLNVYFNQFVSNEGIGGELPQGGLLQEDFIPETGEPKLTSVVQNKIEAMGVSLCASEEITRGGIFGQFLPEPNNGYFQQEGDFEDGRQYSIVDSYYDFDPDHGAGVNYFLSGFKWNHHIYCAGSNPDDSN